MDEAMDQTISVPEAARRLGITPDEAYELVFARTLRTVEGPTGRRLVPLDALAELSTREGSAHEPA
jgi:hypothetical protein